MGDAMVHFLTHHADSELVVAPVDWLPRHGRHWFLYPDVDALAVSCEAWESGYVDTILGGIGIRLRLPSPGERGPARATCALCGGPRRSPEHWKQRRATELCDLLDTRPAPPKRPTVNDRSLLAPRKAA